jgi:hypothetical protein
VKIDIEVEVKVEVVVGVELEVCVYTTQSVAEHGKIWQGKAGQGKAEYGRARQCVMCFTLKHLLSPWSLT